jgi:hypothetical protein
MKSCYQLIHSEFTQKVEGNQFVPHAIFDFPNLRCHPDSRSNNEREGAGGIYLTASVAIKRNEYPALYHPLYSLPFPRGSLREKRRGAKTEKFPVTVVAMMFRVTL